MSDTINEIWSLYADEGQLALDLAEESLLELKANPADTEAIGGLFRGMHTFKGNSRLLGLSIVEARAHLAEDLIGLVRDEGVPLDDALLELLHEALDAMRGMLEDTLANRRDIAETAYLDLADRMRAQFAFYKPGAVQDGAPGKQAATSTLTETAAAETACPLEPIPAEARTGDDDAPLAGDPICLQIFRDMVADAGIDFRAALARFDDDQTAAREEIRDCADRLLHGALQIGLKHWQEILTPLAGQAPLSHDEADALINAVAAAGERELGLPAVDCAPEPAGAPTQIEPSQPIAAFFEAVAPLLAGLAEFDPQSYTGAGYGLEAIDALAAQIEKLATASGLNGIAAAAANLRSANTHTADFPHLVFAMLEELARAETVANVGAVGFAPQALGAWCAARALETIIELDSAADAFIRGEEIARSGSRICALLREMRHACEHYGLDIAAKLAMALADHFERARSTEAAADSTLIQTLKSYLEALDVLFASARRDETPDLSGIEALLQQTENIAFTQCGAVSAATIEARLDLPKSFHRVLTPESVQAAMAALDAGQHFYIVSADLNPNEKMTQAFLGWISGGAATVITNVSCFEGGVTEYDFLLASRLTEAAFAEALATLDPSGKALRLEATLHDHNQPREPIAATESQELAIELGAGTQDIASRSMLEAIGEIITGHAAARQILRTLVHADPMHVVETELRAADGDWKAAREAVRHRLRDWQDRMEQLLQVDTQLSERLDRLQETAVSVRSRPASALLNPIAVFANALAASRQRRLSVETSGGDIELDFGILDALKAPLRALVTYAITTSIETDTVRRAAGKPEIGRLAIAVARSEDHVTITVEDDGRGPDLGQIRTRARELGWTEDVSANMMLREEFGGADSDGVNLADLRRNLLLQGGDLGLSIAQGGGTRFQIVLPLAMVVIDGMVVRTGEVIYVVPVGGIQRIVQCTASAIIRVSAGGGSHLLRLDNGDLLPVRCLRGDSDHRERLPDAGSLDGACVGIGHSAGVETANTKFLFLIAGTDANRIAVPVDELIGQQLVLVRPLQGYLSGIQGVTGCALLGGGGVGMVLDMGFVLEQGKAA